METDYLLRSPENAERLKEAMARADAGEGQPLRPSRARSARRHARGVRHGSAAGGEDDPDPGPDRRQRAEVARADPVGFIRNPPAKRIALDEVQRVPASRPSDQTQSQDGGGSRRPHARRRISGSQAPVPAGRTPHLRPGPLSRTAWVADHALAFRSLPGHWSSGSTPVRASRHWRGTTGWRSPRSKTRSSAKGPPRSLAPG